MAGTITYKAALSATFGTFFKQGREPGQLSAEQTTMGSAGDTQIIGFAADEIVAVGDLVAPRWAYFRNLDLTNSIKLGPTTGGAILELIRLKPGEACIFPLGPSVVLRAQALVAVCNLEKFILET